MRAVRDELPGSHRKCAKVAFCSRGSVDEKWLLEERYILHTCTPVWGVRNRLFVPGSKVWTRIGSDFGKRFWNWNSNLVPF